MAQNFDVTKKFQFVSPGITSRDVEYNPGTPPIKFATHMVLFGQDKWVMRNLENAYPHVETIYIAISDKPWTYNPAARDIYKNSVDYKQIIESPWGDKVRFIHGEWATEEDQRNACAEIASRDGIDYLLIHDADEFYFHADFEKILNYIRSISHKNFDYYKIAWYCFWKSFNNILLDSSGQMITGYPEFCINLRNGVRFQSKRRPNKTNVHIIPPENGICYHGSYVLTNEELLQKINTWGHTNDFNKDHWYKEKWLKWNPQMTDLHLVSPSAWSRAVLFQGEIPEVIADMKEKL